MKFEISGKGIVCNVYYIERDKLDEVSSQVCPNGPGLKDVLLENSDFIVNVSKGFFLDSSLANFEFKLSNGDSVTQEFFEEKLVKLLEDDMTFEEGVDPRDYKCVNFSARERDINKSQVGIVEYHEFEDGEVSIDIPCEDVDKIQNMRLLCESVDKDGDFATTATYLEGIVGGEEYESAEYAIDGIEIDGEVYNIPAATFNKAHSRVWQWLYNEESGQHEMDFFGSQSLPDPWDVEIIDIAIGDLYEDFDHDFDHLDIIKTFLNQKSLDWIEDNNDFVSSYLKSHRNLKNLISLDDRELVLPSLSKDNVKIGALTVLCMLLSAFGVAGLDPEKIDQLDDFELHFLDFETLTLGNELLLSSVHKSFAMHFGVIGEVSTGNEEAFPEVTNPTLHDAVEFVGDILDDPESSFNQNKV